MGYCRAFERDVSGNRARSMRADAREMCASRRVYMIIKLGYDNCLSNASSLGPSYFNYVQTELKGLYPVKVARNLKLDRRR